MMISSLNNSLISFEEIYEHIVKKSTLANKAELLLSLRAWYISIAIFDDKTGESLVTETEEFLLKISSFSANQTNKDYISRVIDYSEESLKYIFINPREKILREHAIIPIYAAREVDSSSVQWLSRRSGRNLREKLAEKPYIKAVKRRFSLDTIENRLVKAFVYRLENLLFIKEDAKMIDTYSSDLLQDIQHWLHQDMTKEIGNWSNLPPNNTLLQDKHYRKIWNSWLWIQNIDELVYKDNQNSNENFLTLLMWSLISELNKYNQVRLLQQPVYLDYDNFTVKTKKKVYGTFAIEGEQRKLLCEYKDRKIKISMGNKILFICEMGSDNTQLKVMLNSNMKSYKYSAATTSKIKEEFIGMLIRDYKLSKRKVKQIEEISGHSAILDFDSIYPKFMTDKIKNQRVPFRFVSQYWKNEEEQVYVNCAEANAILIGNNIDTISMKNLFTKDISKNLILFSSALNSFTKDISKYLKVKNLTYLVSDSINEFESEKLRKSMNLSFNDAIPLPRSIASVFALYNDNDEMVSNYDFVVVVEASDEKISITKLMPIIDTKLEEIIPQSEGVIWERHPSIDLDLKTIPKKFFQKQLKNKVLCDIADVWGKEGIELDADKLSWMSDDGNYLTLKQDNNKNFISIKFQDIQSKLNIKNNQKVKIILHGEYSKSIEIKSSTYPILNVEYSLLDGANRLNLWQKEVEKYDISLWRDHLPNLSFNIPQAGRYTDFYLVKDTTIVPRKGKVTKINIDKPLTLPKNKTFYEFPLTLGSGSQELEFMASLRSSVLPLSKDVTCDLIMTYTYGADDPYELYFVPKDEEEKKLFKSIKVEWKDLSKRKKIDAPIPDFPKRYSWKDFEKNYNKKTNEYSNLLEWIGLDVNRIVSLDKFISGNTNYIVGERTFMDMHNVEWKQASNGDYFCRFLLPDNKEVFIHQDEYEEFNINYQKISFDLKNHRGGLVAINITKGKSITNLFEFVNKLRKSMRFPVITVWNQGHSLSETDVPENFILIVRRGIKSAISLLKEKELNIKIKEELRYLLSLLHKDTPLEVSSYLLSQSDSKNINKQDNARMIAYAIGDATLDWQKKLLDNAINSSKRIIVLSIALWRSESLVYLLSQKQLEVVIDEILSLKFSKDKKDIFYLTQKLEVLLALLRTRGSKNSEIKAIFEIDSISNKKLIQKVEKLTEQILKQNILIKTRITFNLNKPKALNKTPDLLYALRLYLTGEDGANSIEVAEVESD